MRIPESYRNYKFIVPDPTLQNNLLAFGFEIGEGWMPIIDKLFRGIQAEIDKQPEDYYKDFYITQVKEKFGTLRVYCSYYYSELEDLIDKAERESSCTCEQCGEEGYLKTVGGWDMTLCEKCHKLLLDKIG